jgi:predicted ATPase
LTRPPANVSLDGVGVTRLVGRAEELDRLAQAIREARHVLVTGEVGIGKTRLVAHAAQAARRTGATVLEGACLPLDVRLPLLPFIEILRGLGASLGRPTFAEVLADIPPYAVDELTRLVPEVIGHQAGPDELPAGEWQRQRVFDAVDVVLSHAACAGPVVIVVEDLHWSDAATLDLLTYLRASSRAAVTLIVTCRRVEALVRPVARWIDQAR